MRWTLALLMLALVVPGAALAQNRPGGPEQQRERVMATGTIKAIAPGRVHVVNDEGDQWLVAIDPKAEVVVTGMATPGFLRPGMFVRFTGKFNRKAEALEPLGKLIVFTPRAPEPMQREREVFDPAAAEAARGLFKTDEPMPQRKPVKTARPAKPAKPPEIVDVATSGAVVGMRSGKLQVRGAEGTFKFELKDDAELTLDINDYRLAQVGDKIDIEGWSYAADKTQVLANRVTIRLKETVGEVKKKDEQETDKQETEKPVDPLEAKPGATKKAE